MKKPHWETLQNTSSHVRSIASKFGTDILQVRGPLVLMAAIRRIMAVKFSSPEEKLEIFSKVKGTPLTKNDLVGDVSIAGVPQDVWMRGSSFSKFIMFVKGGEKVYKIAREFGEELVKVDLEIKSTLLPTFDYTYCIEFPDNIRFHDSNEDDYFHCAYVTCQKRDVDTGGTFDPIDKYGKQVYCVVDILLPCYDKDGNLKDAENNLVLSFRSPDESIEESFQRAKESSTHPLHSDDAIRFILKCMVYLDSGDPDLREYRAPKPPNTTKVKKQRRWFKDHLNHSLIDMTLVGFDFKKPRASSGEDISVSGHFRWQPYGPNREKVKLIWIDAYIKPGDILST